VRNRLNEFINGLPFVLRKHFNVGSRRYAMSESRVYGADGHYIQWTGAQCVVMYCVTQPELQIAS
jgi:hypothetical protein